MDSHALTPGSPKQPVCPVDFADLLWEELAEIQKLRLNRQWDKGDISATRSQEAERRNEGSQFLTPEKSDRIFKAAHDEELVGLAFSGGGIRSATFNLGVLQGLATLGLLPMFDYLSTVSGGGYIGSWLESWIYRAGQDSEVAKCAELSQTDQQSPIRRVQECLKPDRSDKIEHGESRAIRFLRQYSNYLTPRLGFLGADLWTAVAIYFRNLLLNQTVLILFLFFLLLLPYLAVYLTEILICLRCPALRDAPPVAVFLFVLLAQCGVSRNMTHLTGKDRTGEFPPSARQGMVLVYVVAPLLLAAWCLSVWIWWKQLWLCGWWVWPVGGIVGFALTWSLAALWGIAAPVGQGQSWNSRATKFKSIGFSLLSGAAGGLLLEVLAGKLLKGWYSAEGGIWHVVSFGTPLIVIVFLLVVVLQLGLMGRLAPDPRREWWARLAGWLLILSIVWAVALCTGHLCPTRSDVVKEVCVLRRRSVGH